MRQVSMTDEEFKDYCKFVIAGGKLEIIEKREYERGFKEGFQAGEDYGHKERGNQ